MTDNRDSQAKLLSLAVHELRTPVAVVSGYVRMLLRHFSANLSEQQLKLLQESEKSCGNLANLLSELSELAHFDDGKPALRREPIPVFALLEEVAGGVHEAEDRGVTLEVRGVTPRAVVLGDRDRLATAMRSLLAAALRERVEGVVVAACRVVEPGREAIIAIGDSDTVEQLARRPATATDAFDQYRGGMGFRLPIAACIIAAHGGRVSSPEAARGRLAIVLSLPLATEPERAA